jgi:uncharacterized protein YecE (DUF72 family)
MTSGVTATNSSLTAVQVGTSGWSYPSWRPGFYPEGTRPEEFLSFYAQRFRTVELNTTGYRIPGEEQFRKWAEQVPAEFTFAPKLNGHARAPVGTFGERVRLLGERLGPVRVVLASKRDDGLLALLAGSFDPELRIAWDFRHESWRDAQLPAGTAAVDDLERDAPFRYLRLREPPYGDDELRAWAERIRALGVPAFVYFRHEDEPTAPAYAQRLLELLGQTA